MHGYLYPITYNTFQSPGSGTRFLQYKPNILLKKLIM